MRKILDFLEQARNYLVISGFFLGGGFGIYSQVARFFPYHPPVPNAQVEVVDAFPEPELEGMRERVAGKKMALALITTDDYNGANVGLEDTLQANFTRIPGYELFCQRVNSRGELFNALRDYSLVKDIDALILAFHGNGSAFEVSFLGEVNTFNVAGSFRHYAPLFEKDAVVLLYSCSTGKGKSNIATHLADVLGVDVIAPRVPLGTQADISLDERVDELACDESGRLSFNYANFVRFEKLREYCDKGSIDEDCVAQISHCGCKDAVVDETRSGRDDFLVVDK